MGTAILLHGLAHWPFVWASNAAMTPLRWYLEKRGYTVEQMSYNGDHEDHDAIVERVAQVVDAAQYKVVIIGHSYGGIIARSVGALRKDKVEMVVAIASPLNGAAFLEYVESVVPSLVRGSNGYQKIKEIEPDLDISPVCMTSVSVGLPGHTTFDSCVYRDETIGRDGHIHVEWSEHRVAPLDPRVWAAVSVHLDRVGMYQ